MTLEFIKDEGDDGRPMYRFPFDRRYVVPGDIHFPQHVESLVEQYTIGLASPGIKDVLFLQGDTGDQTAFSKFLKDPEKIVKTDSMIRERECWADWIERWLGYFEYIAIGPGNHGGRAARLTYTNPAFLGMGWWWPYGDLFKSQRIIILDEDYRAQVRENSFIEHGENLKGNRSKTCPAADVAAKNPGNQTIIFGHTHRCAEATHTRYVGGKKQMCRAVNVGTLQDTKKQGWLSEPNWQPGAAVVDDKITLYQ